MIRKISLVCLLAGLLPAFTAPAMAAEPAPIVVCYPGCPVNEADANAAMESMLRVVERVGQWKDHSLSSVFTAKADECRDLLAEKKPDFAITSLGLFLEQREAHHLVPLVQPRMKGSTSERYQVVATKGKFGSLEQLKGKSLGGTVLEEPEFVKRIVFAGKIDPETYFALRPSRQALRALRSLDKDELDAVLLNGQQSAGLASLQLKSPVEPVFTSEEIPLMGLAADSKTTTAEERARFARALEGMCSDPEGQKLCDLFGVEAFAPVEPGVFEPMIKLWDKGK
jgi:hypothetical protein